MNTRTIILGLLVSIALLSVNPASFSQSTNEKSLPTPTIAPGTENNNSSDNSDLTLTSQSKMQPVNDDDINRFTNTIALIKDFYVQPTGDKTLLDDAIRGMVSGLDPHSEYLDSDAYKTLMVSTSGEFGGVGIEVTPEFGILKIITPMDDTPAKKAGIKPGDYIVAINGKLVSEMSLQDAVDQMRGKPGSQIILTVLRKGEKIPLIFKMNREVIRIVSVKSKMLDNHFGYIRLTQFQEPTAKLMRDAILDLKSKSQNQLKGLILDLRNNPGGLLETAVQVVNTFLNSNKLNNKYDDLIVYTEGRLPEAQYRAKADGEDMLNGAPIVVLINGGSASASEIVAGALQDYHRALIAGTTSFGKGSVQTVIPLDKSHALKLTTALYHTPSGRVIQNIGILPDIKIEDLKVIKNQTDEDIAMMEPIKEYQLKNHLAGSPPTAADTKIAEADDTLLANQDYQLYEALKILRTMSQINNLFKS